MIHKLPQTGIFRFLAEIRFFGVRRGHFWDQRKSEEKIGEGGGGEMWHSPSRHRFIWNKKHTKFMMQLPGEQGAVAFKLAEIQSRPGASPLNILYYIWGAAIGSPPEPDPGLSAFFSFSCSRLWLPHILSDVNFWILLKPWLQQQPITVRCYIHEWRKIKTLKRQWKVSKKRTIKSRRKKKLKVNETKNNKVTL